MGHTSGAGPTALGTPGAAHGKTPVGVARLARTHGVPVVALAGSVGAGSDALYAEGIQAIFPILPGVCTLEEALADAASNLSRTAGAIARLWSLSALNSRNR